MMMQVLKSRPMAGKEHEGTLQNDENVPYFNLGGGYTNINV